MWESVPCDFRQMFEAMNAPVQGNSNQSEDAGIHGKEDDEVHHFTHHRSEHPLIHGVDGGLERHTEDDKAKVRDAQVEDK